LSLRVLRCPPRGLRPPWGGPAATDHDPRPRVRVRHPGHPRRLFNLQTFGNVYSRISNPTVAVLEERIASLEGGRAALACATGMAAQMTALLAILKAGDHIVAASTLYGGSVGQLGIGFSRLGILWDIDQALRQAVA
jgi:O-acetylhomoserine/O-acetylserine sulfhydrylase-like pyridoxal-dependent enzyme